tara:strand:- start:290 stop:1138 length:849 start_codon:yes stop_codon:yes gene_type:complete
MPCFKPAFEISKFVSKLVGEVQGRIMAKVTEVVAEAQEKLQGQCPPVPDLERIIKQRDNLINATNGIEKKLEPIEKFADKMENPIKTAKIIITILEFLPIPSTIGTPPTGSPSDVGGTIYSMPTGKLNRFASLLRIACKIVETLERERKNIKEITSIGLSSIQPTREKLESIDFNLFECVNDLGEDDRDRINNLVQNLPSNEGIGLLDSTSPTNFNYYKPSSGINYNIRIINDPDSPSFAPRRYAAVFTQDGVEVLRGPTSFSSSTRVLVDEIKFRINNQLP